MRVQGKEAKVEMAYRFGKQQIAQYAAIGASLFFFLAMVSPTLDLSREVVQRAKCVSNLKRLGTAISLYLEDNRYMMPPSGGIAEFEYGEGWGWCDKFYPYLSGIEVFKCPTARKNELGEEYFCSYILNMRVFFDTAGKGASAMLQVTNGARLIVLYDRNASSGNVQDADMTDDWNNSGGDGYGQGGLWYSRKTESYYPGPHDGGHNILFADWHVRWFGEWDSEKMTRHAEL